MMLKNSSNKNPGRQQINRTIYPYVAVVALILGLAVLWVAQEVVVLGVAVFMAVAVVLGVLVSVLMAWEWSKDKDADRQIKYSQAQLTSAQAVATLNNTVTAPAGHQIVHVNYATDVAKNMHLAASVHVNGYSPSSNDDRWLAYHALHGLKPPPGGGAVPMIEGPLQSEALQPILPILVRAQRLILAGGSDAGKTTLKKWIIVERVDHSLIIVIDPHAPSKILGYDVIGAGRDYKAIGKALESLVLLMTIRYEDVKIGTHRYGDHQRISVFVDEWTSIQKNVPKAGEMLATLLIESRKVNIHLCLAVHSLTVDVLGIDAQIRNSATQVELFGGDGQERRAFIHPKSKINPDGGRAKPTEYALPGPFAGFAEPQGEVVKALPDPKLLKAQMMLSKGESWTAIAKEYFETDKPNGAQINAVKEMLQNE